MASSNVIRDPVQDQLLTSQNAALVVIDYQPVQVRGKTTISSPP
jgi:hypothetical protein